jgi:hypothetical protein
LFVVVVLAAGIGSFFLTRSLLSSDGDATAEGSLPSESPTGLKREMEETLAKINADQAKGRFTGELGDYFYIAAPGRDPVPPELTGAPYPPGSCSEVAVDSSDTSLYVGLPPVIDGIKITPTSPPQAVKCAGEIVSVQHGGKMETAKGSAEVSVAKGYLYHPRYVFLGGASRDRYELTEIAGKPAVLLASFGWPEATHLEVILEPYRIDAPGVTLGIDADLPGPQAVALAEEIIASTRGRQ